MQRSIGLHCMNSVTVFLKDALDLKTFEKQLHSLLPAKGAEQELSGTIYRIKALAFLDNAKDVYQVHYVRQSKYVSVTKSKTEGNHQPSFVFVGMDLKEDALKAWLSSCRAKPAEPLPERTRKSVSAAEVADITKEHIDEPLPPGYFHNGRQYVCMDGSKSDAHPALEGFVEEWLVGANAKVKDHNAKLAEVAPQGELFGMVSGAKKASTPQKAAPPTAHPPGRRRPVTPQKTPAPPTTPPNKGPEPPGSADRRRTSQPRPPRPPGASTVTPTPPREGSRSRPRARQQPKPLKPDSST